MNNFIKDRKTVILSYCFFTFLIFFLLGLFISNYTLVGFAQDTKQCCVKSCRSDGVCVRRCADFPVSDTCPSDRCTSNSQCNATQTTTSNSTSATKRCCFDRCSSDGRCLQCCGYIPVSDTCPSDRCTSDSQCSVSSTKYCCTYACSSDGICAQRCGYIDASQTCPSSSCRSDSDCSGTKQCCANRCNYGTGKCVNVCGTFPASSLCPSDSCRRDADCQTEEYTCMYCCAASKTCEPYTSYLPCGPECLGSRECQEQAVEEYTYLKCSNQKCIEAKSNYAIRSECRIDEDCKGSYHKECVQTPYRYITYDAYGNRIVETGITYNCKQLYYPGTNECTIDISCCPGGNCGGNITKTYYCNVCSNGSCVKKSYSSPCSSKCQNNSDCSSVANFDFSIDNPSAITVFKPSSGTVKGSNTIKVSLVNGATKTVTFSQRNLPSGVSASNILSCSPACSKVNTLSISSSAPLGIHPITIIVTGGGITREARYNLIIQEEGSTDVYGCTDPIAVNYNSLATIYDGSCLYDDNEDNDSHSCTITKFELPNRAWVDIKTTASWSTNEDCTHAQINCISDDCIEGVENLSGSNLGVGFGQEKDFTINAPGTYRYELVACTGPIPADPHNDEDCDVYEDILGTGDPYIEIEALHLPWWQEIIPSNLQGLLRGLLGDR